MDWGGGDEKKFLPSGNRGSCKIQSWGNWRPGRENSSALTKGTVGERFHLENFFTPLKNSWDKKEDIHPWPTKNNLSEKKMISEFLGEGEKWGVPRPGKEL